MTIKSKEPKHISKAVKSLKDELKVTEPSPKKDRIVKAGFDIYTNDYSNDEIVFQHSLLCQAVLPYKDLKEATFYERTQGKARVALQGTRLVNPKSGEWEDVGLPYGAMPRVMMGYFNTEAVRTGSPVIKVEDSFTAFVKAMGFQGNKRQIDTAKEQLRRLHASLISLHYMDDDKLILDSTQIIKGVNVWFPKDDKQRILWDSEVRLNGDYFESLAAHAVPLDKRALVQLSDSAVELDIYFWLSQRLHRIKDNQFITWNALWQQFGQNYGRIDKFKAKFRDHIKKVLAVYPTAKVIENKNKGFTLYNSPPPILKGYVRLGGNKG